METWSLNLEWMIFGKVKGILTYHCQDWRSRFEKSVDNLTSNGCSQLVDCVLGSLNRVKQVCVNIFELKFTVTLHACLIKSWFWSEASRARVKTLVLYIGKQDSINRIRSKIHLKCNKKKNHLLLRIISRICKELRIHLAFDTINTFDCHSIFICMNEIFV